MSQHSRSVPSTPSSGISSNLNDGGLDDLPPPKPFISRYYFDANDQVKMRGPPTASANKPPSTAELNYRKVKNEEELKALDEKYALTFDANVRAMTLTGYLYVQTSTMKNDRSGWKEMYCILDPFTKMISVHTSKQASKCYKALSIAGGRVIYGGEMARQVKSVNGGKQKLVKVHCIELTVQPRHIKHYFGSSDKGLTMNWVKDLAKVVHLGADETMKTDKMKQREEEILKAQMAASSIKKIKNKHKLQRVKEYEAEVRRLRLERDQKAREEAERLRPKTPKWMKEFSVDGLIEELSKEREEKLAEKLSILEEQRKREQEEKQRKLKDQPQDKSEGDRAISALVEPTSKKKRSMFDLDDDTDEEENSSVDMGTKSDGLPSFISSALGTTFHDARRMMYERASVTYIQRLYRGRLQRRKFRKNLVLHRYQMVTKKACRERRRILASRMILHWYRARKFFLRVIFPIEDQFCLYKEGEVVRLLKQWLKLCPPEVSEDVLTTTLPKAMYKYLSSGEEGKTLNESGKRLLELINPRYVGKEHLYATSQCFMCGRPKKACGRLLKSLPSAVRKTNRTKELKHLRLQLRENESKVVEISRDHTLLVSIAEASLKAAQCRVVSDTLRMIWRKDGRAIEPEDLPTQLLAIENQCWSKVAQYYRLRGSTSHQWSQDAAMICVRVCEMQFGGWTDKSGLHLFSDHPALCISRLHYAHTIMGGKSGKRDLKSALKIIRDARDALYAWTGAQKARESRLKILVMKNWKEFVWALEWWRVTARSLRFYNLRVQSRRIAAQEAGIVRMKEKRTKKQQTNFLVKFQEFATIQKRIKRLNRDAATFFFSMFVRKVVLEWRYHTEYRLSVRERGLIQKRLTKKNITRRMWDEWFRIWWEKEREHRATQHGLLYTSRHYFVRFIAGATRMKLERKSATAMQKTVRRFVVRSRNPIEIFRNDSLNSFTKGRIGRYLDDSNVKMEVLYRGKIVTVHASFVCEQVRRRNSFSLRTKKLSTSVESLLRNEFISNLIVPKFMTYAFPTPPPSKPLLQKILDDYHGTLIRKRVHTSLDKKEYFEEATEAICGHMVVLIKSVTEDRRSVRSKMSYPFLLKWMEANLQKNSSGFQKSMNGLLRNFLEMSKKEDKRSFVSDSTEMLIESKKRKIESKDVKRMLGSFGRTIKKYSTKKVSGAVSLYVPWMLSIAVKNVCKRETGLRKELEEIHESVSNAASFATLRESVILMENAARRETALLLLMDRRIKELNDAANVMRNLSIALAEEQFNRIYPNIRAICNHLDLFRGNPSRKIVDAKGTPKFIFATVMKLELDTIQELAAFVRSSLNEQLVSAKVLSDLSKLFLTRRKIYRKIVKSARDWKASLLDDIFECVGTCERLAKQRKRSEEVAVSSLGVRNDQMYERFFREMNTYDAVLKSRQVELYVHCQRLNRRIRAESDAIEQETRHLNKIKDLAEVEVEGCRLLMDTRRAEIADLWSARQERIDYEQNEHNKERRATALHRGTMKGKARASRHTFSSFKDDKKLVRRCKYYYEKILMRRAKMQKVDLTDDERWDRFGAKCLDLENEVTHLKEVVQHRKPIQKYSLSVSKLHQVELILEKLLTAARGQKLNECRSKEKPILQRIEASRIIMMKQLPPEAHEFKKLKIVDEKAHEVMNNIKRLELIFSAREKEDGDKTKYKTKKDRLNEEIHAATKVFAQKVLENTERAERRIERLNNTLHKKRKVEERAALFVQAVWNYRKMKTVAHKVHETSLIINSQNRFRRWKAKRYANALRIQRWLRHIKWSEKQMIKVKAEVRDAKRERIRRKKVGSKLKQDYDKLWDVANQRYMYKHRKLPGIILKEKPSILGDDDVLSPRSRRRKNWAQATGGREDLNEIEAAHVIVKFMRLTLFKDAGGFLISQQWYGKWKLDRRPNKEQATLIIQKIVRTEIERWGGLRKFGKRVSHNNELMKRRMKSRTKGKKAGGMLNSAPQFDVIPLPVDLAYCGQFWRAGERERKRADRIRQKLLNANRGLKKDYVEKKRSGWDSFFSNAMRDFENVKRFSILTGLAVGGNEIKNEKRLSTIAKRISAVSTKVQALDKVEKGKQHEKKSGWKSMIEDTVIDYKNVIEFKRAAGEGYEGLARSSTDIRRQNLSEAMAERARAYRRITETLDVDKKVAATEEGTKQNHGQDDGLDASQGDSDNADVDALVNNLLEGESDDDASNENVFVVSGNKKRTERKTIKFVEESNASSGEPAGGVTPTERKERKGRKSALRQPKKSADRFGNEMERDGEPNRGRDGEPNRAPRSTRKTVQWNKSDAFSSNALVIGADLHDDDDEE